MRKKNIIVSAALAAICCCSLRAQDSSRTKIREIYLTFAAIKPLTLGLTYKQQLSKKLFLKAGLNDFMYRPRLIALQSGITLPFKGREYSAGAGAGLEVRHSLFPDLTFFHGPGFSLWYRKLEATAIRSAGGGPFEVSDTRSLAVPYTLGLMLNVAKRVFVAVETNPGLMIQVNHYYNGQGPDDSDRDVNLDLGFHNRLLQLSAVYRFSE